MAFILVLVGLLWSSPAAACELGDECDRVATHTLAVFAAHSLMSEPATPKPSLVVIPAYEKPEENAAEMPWIWQEIRRLAVARLPKKQVDRINAMLAPTVVNTGFSSTLGVGLLGKF